MGFTIFGLHITWSWLPSLCIGFLGIGIMILVHELGHMVAARACGITVEALRFGFGPAIVKWTRGETTYIIGAIPFGGSCRMAGQDDLRSAIAQKKKHIDVYEDGSIWSVGPLKRLLTYLAGPLSNMLFAFLCYALLMSMPTIMPYTSAKIVLASDYSTLYSTVSYAAQNAGLETGDTVLSVNGNEVSSYDELQEYLSLHKNDLSVDIETDRGSFTVFPTNGVFGILPYREPVVGHVNADSPEKKAGLKSGDRIISVNGQAVTNMMDLVLAAQNKGMLDMTVLRSEEEVEISFECLSSSLNFTLVQQTQKIKGSSFLRSLAVSGRECIGNFIQSITSLIAVLRGTADKGQTLGGTFSASQSIGMLTTQGFSQSFNNGIRTMMFLLASVSISLAVANLLPIPALDGGLILLSFAEFVCKKTFHPRVYIIMQTVGLIIIVVALVLLTFF